MTDPDGALALARLHIANTLHVWDVSVFHGAGDIPIEPSQFTRFGTPSVTLGDAGVLSAPHIDLEYTGVAIRHVDDWMQIEWLEPIAMPDGGCAYTNHCLREMDIVRRVEFDDGRIRVAGMEARADGALVMAMWFITPTVTNAPAVTD